METLADGLRAFADWLEQNPEVEAYEPKILLQADTRADVVALTHKLPGMVEKDELGPYFTITARFGLLTVWAAVAREQVCRRVITGKRVIPAEVIPAVAAKPAVTVPEHEEDIVEWKCDPLLASAIPAIEGGPDA